MGRSLEAACIQCALSNVTHVYWSVQYNGHMLMYVSVGQTCSGALYLDAVCIQYALSNVTDAYWSVQYNGHRPKVC